ncbi:flavoprotein [Streptomyces violaceorubidus]|uniref:Flavoprotein n=1 Tax=Streptomyces violaceorubidus TaxID=284042 RepID=A0ABV1SUU3_9ACTN
MTSETPSTFDGRLLIGATGSAAVALLPAYINALRATFTGTITVVMTHTAGVFLPPHTVSLFADRVVTGARDAWQQENPGTLAADHDLMAILPSSAHTLSAVATGAAPNMLTATVAAAEVPVVFFPVMTGAMWAKPAVRRNVDQLRLDGHHVIDPQVGQRYDVALGGFVESPVPPAPPAVVEVVREFMPRRGPVAD